LLGNLADRGGARNALLRITTIATIVVIALMPLVALDSDYLLLGAILIALAVVFSELAGVFVNSVLPVIPRIPVPGITNSTSTMPRHTDPGDHRRRRLEPARDP